MDHYSILEPESPDKKQKSVPAEAAWRAVHGTKRHVVVGKTAKRLAFMLRWAPGLVARMRPKRGE